MKILTVLLLAACFLVTLALGAQNQQLVNFDFLLAQGEFQLSTLLGIAFGSGFVIGWLICGLLYLKTRFTKNRLSKKVQKQKQELDQLRAEPVKE
ncbi:LapA family protein [Photobacterium sp. DNB23_23_1]|uniref:Probable lipopolysaccharide assembly protein A n=1 Tax=Photobacterium pectinilyticum TaxID=2906793 RepID=A0ABT1MYY5_9GAMM|nr:lipopolysaccharide assembly protein LapA domain-containing protein [Photobacterium sp. ZSDE20]MCQ1057708.1 lipopolysaccharide assembly protein LapA domain-containing protein [Photobacterium sp. ZSDE20]MDD1822081.1 lipopolysaccharide assembly protein LapA domain-containing protein [Photobacterium sp. ZSDE20]